MFSLLFNQYINELDGLCNATIKMSTIGIIKTNINNINDINKDV